MNDIICPAAILRTPDEGQALRKPLFFLMPHRVAAFLLSEPTKFSL
ncbi:hypothetical protein FORC52_1239 [Salmonella enterica subsp. enterica serovar Enteritidis]|nr:hypothetical protein FORC52_1239 [Salmonella enterica subsp. enterica serovar Enteritidis]ATD43506.1 hypothetical protein FORC51_1285 [Salmonella enterica]AUC48241.1 hypothetical protein FORC50_1285 [Salmonella enterica subsp. enterica serovar Typhimurium]EPI93537.1 hypothetical protein A678_04827 [Salmonella enterica subsp. enterica serovar Enteritidis str. 2010K-0271]EPI95252.1 hypothetical protein A677_04475 [Salmonella enterica subsp. enterica serovar Enteritidis str. 2010K-0267]EPI9587